MAKIQLILVGGFLGAGKTTLLARAARHLAARGKRVGLITNDQASNLVDSQYLTRLGIDVGEVAGGCFCCRFEDLQQAANRLLAESRPDCLLSEPVGSCTDIAATVVQPMKRLWGDWAEVSPFSVLADPRRLRQALDGSSDPRLPDCVRYIIRKQLEEADCIVINKVDLLTPDEQARLKRDVSSAWPDTRIFDMSALNDHGVAAWLDAVTAASDTGRRILEIDYDRYALGEAELGWLNSSIELKAPRTTDWGAVALELVRRIQAELASRSAEIGHLKLLVTDSSGMAVAGATGLGDPPSITGRIGTGPGPATLVINARACTAPGELKAVVERALAAVTRDGIQSSILELQSFSPAYPKPTHRIDAEGGEVRP